MPNWCDNFLVVMGTKEEVKKFDEAFKGYPANWDDEEELKQGYCLNALYPVPPEVLNVGYSVPDSRDIKEKLKNLHDPEKWTDGYSWCVSHWGTKWDIRFLDVEVIPVTKSSTIMRYNFLTAWSPPDKWLLKVAKDWPQLQFTLLYFEPGMCFGGEILAQGHNAEIKEYVENVPQEILELFEG